MSPFRESYEYFGYRAVAALARRTPLSPLQRVLAVLARAAFDRGGRRRRWALANLRIAYPELSEEERCQLGRESFVHSAWNLADVLRSETWGTEELLRHTDMRGVENIEEALKGGRGAIMLTLHMGNFEIGAAALPLHGVPFSMVARAFANERLWDRAVQHRTRTGAQLIERAGAAKGMLRALREGRIVGVLNDQYSRRARGVLVPLFGARCSTTAGIATIALRMGTPILPGYMFREGRDTHVGVFGPPIDMPPRTGDRRLDIVRVTARCNEVIEEIIRRHPDQWMWATRRFRHSPDVAEDLYA